MAKDYTFDSGRHPVTTARPRLLGSREYLQKLVRERAEEWQRMFAQAGSATQPATQAAATGPAATGPATGPAGTRPASTRPRRRRDTGGFYDINARVLALGIDY